MQEGKEIEKRSIKKCAKVEFIKINVSLKNKYT
jgi:hypothetical protein